MTKTIDLKANMRAGLGSLAAGKKKGLFEPTAPVEADPFPASEVLDEPKKDETNRQGAVAVQPSLAGEECDQRMTVPMTLKQRHSLERIEQLCRENKLKKPQRLTSNVAIRVLIDMVAGIDEDFSQVATADDLMEVFSRYIVRQRQLNSEGAGNGSQNNR